MRHGLAVIVGCAALALACGGGANPAAPSAARLPRLARTRFLAFGDSLTSGEVTAPIIGSSNVTKQVVVSAASYPSILLSLLSAKYSSQSASIAVVNQGRGGETIFDGVLRFDNVFSASRDEVVLLQEGVNGISVGDALASTSLMRAMVQRAKNGGARVFVGSMLPTLLGRQRSQDPAALEAYNAALRAMCTIEGVTYVDLYNGMLPDAPQLMGIDGLHPTEAGYRRVAELFFAAIARELEE